MKKRNLTFDLPNGLYARAALKAKRQGLTVDEYLRRLILRDYERSQTNAQG